MNANELADAMMTIEQPHPTWTKAATMLRKQQDEIEALKAENQFFRDLMGDVEILRKVQENER